jgi:hypothetical protein
MPLFLAGSTTCAFCGQALTQRVEAAQLPLVDPAANPAFAPLVWRFVHRHCWEDYPQREVYSQAARELILRANPHELTPLHFEQESLFMLGVPAARAGRVKDTWAPFEADVPASKAPHLADGILNAFTRQVKFEHVLGSATWQIEPSKNGVVLTLSAQTEPFERLELPRTRQSSWTALAKKLQEVAREH